MLLKFLNKKSYIENHVSFWELPGILGSIMAWEDEEVEG